MESNKIVSFLSPSADPLPLFFFVVMILLVIATITAVRLNAKPEEWDRRWNGNSRRTRNTADKLDAEFGSVNDICDVVATRSEKIAEIMPGILLVLGLLGTFLGLGMALNEASQVLTQAGATGAGALNSDMSHLMGMMQGLGIKFKTSTWGIIGFIVLRFFAESNAFNERRLRWSISKMKEEMDGSRAEESKVKKSNHESLLSALNGVGEKFLEVMTEERTYAKKRCDALCLEINKLTDDMKKSHGETREYQHKHYDGLVTAINTIAPDLKKEIEADRSATAARHESIFGALEKQRQHAAETSEASIAIKKTLEETGGLMRDYIGSSAENLKAMSESAEKIGVSAGTLGATLEAALGKFGGDVKDTLESVKSSLDGAIGRFSSGVGTSLKGIESATASMQVGMESATKGIGDTLSQFGESVQATLGDVKAELKEAIDDFSGRVGASVGRIEGATVQMKDGLEEATAGISRSLTSLSESVNDTLRSAQDSLAKGQESQKAMRIEFLGASTELREYVQKMDANSDKHNKLIESALESVGNSNLATQSTTTEIKKVGESMGRFVDRLESLIADVAHQLGNRSTGESVARLDEVAVKVGAVVEHLERLVGHAERQRAPASDLSHEPNDIGPSLDTP